MELDRAFAGAIGLKHARRAIAVEGDFGVGAIVRKNNIVLEAESDRILEERQLDGRAGGIVRIVEPKYFGAPGDRGRDRRQAGDEAIFPL